jgi:hypothetical protein
MKPLVRSGIPHDLAAVWSSPAATIKAASAAGNIHQADGLSSATFASAQALIICPLPHRQQNNKCPQNIQKMILF